MDRLTVNQSRQLRSTPVMDSGDSKPGYRIYDRLCGKVAPLCLCSNPIWDERKVN